MDHQNRVALALPYITKTNMITINGEAMAFEGGTGTFPGFSPVLFPFRGAQRDGDLYGIRTHGRQIQGKTVAISG